MDSGLATSSRRRMTAVLLPASVAAILESGSCEPGYFDNIRNSIDTVPFRLHAGVMKLDDAAARLEALGNPTRLKIYRALVRAGDAGLPVGRLQDRLKIAPTTLPPHIKTLTVGRLLNPLRDATRLACPANSDVRRSPVAFL